MSLIIYNYGTIVINTLEDDDLDDDYEPDPGEEAPEEEESEGLDLVAPVILKVAGGKKLAFINKCPQFEIAPARCRKIEPVDPRAETVHNLSKRNLVYAITSSGRVVGDYMLYANSEYSRYGVFRLFTLNME